MEKELYSIEDLSKVFSGTELSKDFSGTELSAFDVAQAVVKYEIGLKYGRNEDRVRLEIMEKQIKPMEESRQNAWEDQRAQKIRELIKCEKVSEWHKLPEGESIWNILPKVMADAIAISSYNASMGKIVAAPTGGSCGILPAAVLNVRDHLLQMDQITQNKKDQAMVNAMLVAAGIGLLIAEKATLSGAEGGCQAECGAAAAMAAGAIVTLHNGNGRQISNGAALALKNSLGLTCDPVKGFVLVPCVKRNAFYAVHAVLAAEMAMIGIDSTIPLIQVIKAMNETGKSMPKEFKETAKGGLAVTKEAKGTNFEVELEKIFAIGNES